MRRKALITYTHTDGTIMYYDFVFDSPFATHINDELHREEALIAWIERFPERTPTAISPTIDALANRHSGNFYSIIETDPPPPPPPPPFLKINGRATSI